MDIVVICNSIRSGLEWLKLLGEALQPFAIGGGIVVGLYGLNQWRREMHGRRNAEIAEELLICANEFRDAISYVRNPFYAGHEGLTRPIGEGQEETEEQRRDRNIWFVPIERLKAKQDIFTRMEKAEAPARVRFGSAVIQHLDQLHAIRDEVNRAAGLRYALARDGRLDDPELREHILSQEPILWEGYGEDPLGPRMTEAIAGLQSSLRRHIGAED